MNERCAEVEDLQNQDQKTVYSKVKKLIGKKKYDKI